MSYEALVEEMVAAGSEVLGDRAVDIARDVRGIHVNGDATVDELSVDGKVAVDDLQGAYVDALGPAADRAMRAVAAEYEDELDLPRSLEPD